MLPSAAESCGSWQVAVPLTIGCYVGQALAVGMQVKIDASAADVDSSFCIGAAWIQRWVEAKQRQTEAPACDGLQTVPWGSRAGDGSPVFGHAT